MHVWMRWTIFMWPCERGTSILSGAVYSTGPFKSMMIQSVSWSGLMLTWVATMSQIHLLVSGLLFCWFFRGFRCSAPSLHLYLFCGKRFTPLIDFLACTGWTMHSSDVFIYGREWSWVRRQAERVDEAQRQQWKGKLWVRASKELAEWT